jgi:hypothetical protein
MTIRLTSLVALALAGAFVVGCGDDDVPAPVDGGGTDSGPVLPVCPASAPAPAVDANACCWRASNATRATAPELRLAALRLTAPTGSPLVSSTVRGLLNGAFDAETFNWLVALSAAPAVGTDGTVSVQTGFGQRATDGTFAFAVGGAPTTGGGDPNRWDPITVAGHMTGESLSTEPYVGAGPLTIPVFSSTDPTLLLVELPIYSLTLLSAPLTADRTCVGTRGTTSYDTAAGGVLSAYIRVEDARTLQVSVPPTLDTTLCALVAGALADATYCDGPQSGWTAKPNALCDATTFICETNPAGTTSVCDPATTCNAWELRGEFAAQGVEITP